MLARTARAIRGERDFFTSGSGFMCLRPEMISIAIKAKTQFEALLTAAAVMIKVDSACLMSLSLVIPSWTLLISKPHLRKMRIEAATMAAVYAAMAA